MFPSTWNRTNHWGSVTNLNAPKRSENTGLHFQLPKVRRVDQYGSLSKVKQNSGTKRREYQTANKTKSILIIFGSICSLNKSKQVDTTYWWDNITDVNGSLLMAQNRSGHHSTRCWFLAHIVNQWHFVVVLGDHIAADWHIWQNNQVPVL